MNHAGEIAPLARLARPHVAVITAVENAHIGYLGSIEAIADEKAEILRALEPGGVAVLPADTPLLPRLRAAAGEARVVTFGAAPTADVRLVDLAMDADGSDVAAEVEGERIAFRLNAPGHHMAMNALAALAAARHLSNDPATQIARRWKGSHRSVAAARAGRSRCRAAPRCCSTKATTATPPRCVRRWRCCACSRQAPHRRARRHAGTR